VPEELLGRIRREIDERLKELRPAVEEIPRLEAALAAFDGWGSARGGTSQNGRSRSTTGKRAPRGANRQAILKAVDERPGLGAAELAKVTGMKVTTMRTTLRELIKAGRVTRDEIGGVPGYHSAGE
jgi:hypothetical protein